MFCFRHNNLCNDDVLLARVMSPKKRKWSHEKSQKPTTLILQPSQLKIKSFFPYKDHLNQPCSQGLSSLPPDPGNEVALESLSNVKSNMKASFWTVTISTLHDVRYMTDKLKALTSKDHHSAIADHITTTRRNIKWDNFVIASGKTYYRCKIKETSYIQELKPCMNSNVSSEKLLLY